MTLCRNKTSLRSAVPHCPNAPARSRAVVPCGVAPAQGLRGRGGLGSFALPQIFALFFIAFSFLLLVPDIRAQAYYEWTGGGTNWNDTSNWNGGSMPGYGQLEFKGNGNAISWNNLGNPNSQWRFYFSGSKAYTLGGGTVEFYDYGGQRGGILSDSSATQTINMNLAFKDNTAANPAFILTRNSGGLTLNGNLEIAGGIWSLGFGGTNTNSVITVNGKISGGSGKEVIIGTNAFDGNTTGMGTTRVVFAGSNSYEGKTTILNGILTAAHNNALGATTAGTTVSSGAALHLSNNITISNEALTLAGSGIDSKGALYSASGTNKFLGLITANSSTTYIGAATNATLVVSNVNSGSQELWVAGGGTTIIAGGATNSGSGTAMVKTNTGTLVLAASNAWSGNEYIREGTVVLSNNNALGVGGTTFIGATAGSANSKLVYGANITNSNAITFQGDGGTGLRILAYTNGSDQGAQVGQINLDRTGSGGVTNNYLVQVDTGGTLLLGNTVQSSTVAGDNKQRLIINGGGTVIVTNNGGSSGNDDYQVRVGNGTLIIGKGDIISRTNKSDYGHAIDLGLDDNDAVATGKSSLLASNGVTISNSIWVNGNNTTNSYQRVVGLSGSSGTATYTGEMGLEKGAVTFDAQGTGVVDYKGHIGNFGSTPDAEVQRVIKTGSGTLILNNSTNSYSGATVISNGTIQLGTLNNAGNNSSIGTNSNIILAGSTSGGAVFDYTGGNVTHNRNFVTENGGGTIKMANTNTVMTLTGGSSGTGTLEVGKGILVLSNTTTVNNFKPDTIKVDSGSTLKLGAANQIGDSTKINMNGGTFLTGTSSVGNSDTMGTMTLSANSTLDFGGPNNRHDLNFADSSAVTWQSGTILTITNWYRDISTPDDHGLYGRLYFGNNSSALDSHQLAQIKFDIGGVIYNARILADGEVVPDMPPIPEPKTYAALAALLAAIAWRERKRLSKIFSRQKA